MFLCLLRDALRPHCCSGCHNPDTWDFRGGYETNDLKGTLIKAISANGVNRNFSILGGEPLCQENKDMVLEIILAVKAAYPHIKMFLWTGYTKETLESLKDETINKILSNISLLIDGPYIQNERDISLWLRGSRNQRVFYLTNNKKYIKINTIEEYKELESNNE